MNMTYENLQEESRVIIDKALEQIERELNKVIDLHTTIKENQIREFKKQWKEIFSSPIGIDPKSKFEDRIFENRFKYLINRMDGNNNIKEIILEITNITIQDLKNLWNDKRKFNLFNSL